MANQNTTGREKTEIADSNLARLAIRDLERTMDQLIEVDGRALSLAARAGQMFLDGKVPEHRQEELVRVMEQVVTASVDARRVVKEVGQMVSVTKSASSDAAKRTTSQAEGGAQEDATAGSAGEQQRKAVKKQMRLTKMRL